MSADRFFTRLPQVAVSGPKGVSVGRHSDEARSIEKEFCVWVFTSLMGAADVGDKGEEWEGRGISTMIPQRSCVAHVSVEAAPHSGISNTASRECRLGGWTSCELKPHRLLSLPLNNGRQARSSRPVNVGTLFRIFLVDDSVLGMY
jgi:hypothetical protein